MPKAQNAIGTALRIIGELEIFIGVIISFFVMGYDEDAIAFGVVLLVSSIIGGILIIAFGEAIELLNKIANNTRKGTISVQADSLPRL